MEVLGSWREASVEFAVLFLKHFKKFFYFTCMCFERTYVRSTSTSTGTEAGRGRCHGAELELLVSRHVGAENRTQAFWKNNQCS